MEYPKTAAEQFVGIMREQRAKAAAAEKAKRAFKAVANDELGVIIGIGAAVGSPTNLDLDGEFLEKSDVIKMCFEFTESAERSFKANHDGGVDAKLVASWAGQLVIKSGDGMRFLNENEPLTDEMDVLAIGTDVSKAGHWVVAVQPTDPEVLEAAKAGEIIGFSWAGFVTKTEV